MDYGRNLLLLLIYCLPSGVCAYALQSDQEAYGYCVSNPNAFIAIVWPIAQGKDHLITGAMEQYGKILYRKEYYFTPTKALYILKKAHANIKNLNMKEHLKWYFPLNTYQLPARIFVVQFDDLESNRACKYAIRKFFPSLQYRSIHINDYHHETVELAQLFFTT